MSGLLAYSALSTKVRAMEGNLITSDEFSEMMTLGSVSEVVSYLSRHPGYKDILSGVETGDFHRTQVEQILNLTLFKSFAKIYNFSSSKQRQFISILFTKYETGLLKRCIREIMDGNQISTDIKRLKLYFNRFSDINLDALSTVRTTRDFVAALHGSKYYVPLKHVEALDNPSLFDYEICLDLFHFSSIWKGHTKYLSGKDLEVITNSYGSKIDILNLQWIYRSKKYYHLTDSEILAMIIPIKHKLSASTMKKLIACEDVNAFNEIFLTTKYAKYVSTLSDAYLERLYKTFLDRQHSALFKKNPYSLACVDSFLYQKQMEIASLITLTECIRYSYPVSEIRSVLTDVDKKQ